MTQANNPRRVLGGTFVLAVMVGALAPTIALADEGGVSFRLPGIFGSLAATPVFGGQLAVSMTGIVALTAPI
jgi:hypothetical protein